MQHLERALDKQNHIGKYLGMFVLVCMGISIGTIPLLVIMPHSKSYTDFGAHGVSPNLGFFLMLLPFVTGLITMVRLFGPLHDRSLTEVINGTKRIRWSRFLFAALVWGSLMLIAFLIEYSINPKNFQFNFNFSSFIPLVLIALTLVPLQATFEEVLSRGYLAQGIAAWTRSRWVVLIISASFFALLHSSNNEVKVYGFWVAMPQYLIPGLTLGLIAILDDGIETAMGMHAANNAFLAVFVTNESSSLPTPALFNELHADIGVGDILSAILLSVIFVAILTYKYKWSYSILNKKVQKQPELNTRDIVLLPQPL